MMVAKQKSFTPPLMLLAQLNDALLCGVLFLAITYYLDHYKGLYLGVAISAGGMAMVCFRGMGVYQSWRLAHPRYEFQRLLMGCLTLYLTMMAISYFLEIIDKLPRIAVLTWMVALPLLLGLERVFIRGYLRRHRVQGYNARTAVVVGVGEQATRLTRLVEENLWAGTKILGFFAGEGESIPGYERLGQIMDLPAYVRDQNVDIVFLALSMKEDKTFERLLQDLSDTTVSICVIPDIFFVDMLMGASISYFDNLPIITLRESPLVGMNAIIKRAEDIILASIILILVSPLMLVIALAVKLTSPGPVIFRQWRYGLNCRGIQVYKFRSMRVCEDGYEFTQATRSDPRVTRLGAFLRRTSLDELPQFINVLQGRMSIVGPRPHPVAMNEKYRKVVPGYILRHKVKPGITGLAQVQGWRGQTDTMEKIQKRVDHDLEYLRNWSLLLDLRIIFLTVFRGAWRSNAF